MSRTPEQFMKSPIVFEFRSGLRFRVLPESSAVGSCPTAHHHMNIPVVTRICVSTDQSGGRGWTKRSEGSPGDTAFWRLHAVCSVVPWLDSHLVPTTVRMQLLDFGQAPTKRSFSVSSRSNRFMGLTVQTPQRSVTPRPLRLAFTPRQP